MCVCVCLCVVCVMFIVMPFDLLYIYIFIYLFIYVLVELTAIVFDLAIYTQFAIFMTFTWLNIVSLHYPDLSVYFKLIQFVLMIKT